MIFEKLMGEQHIRDYFLSDHLHLYIIRDRDQMLAEFLDRGGKALDQIQCHLFLRQKIFQELLEQILQMHPVNGVQDRIVDTFWDFQHDQSLFAILF